MKIIQVRDIPDETHRRLKIRAAEEGTTISNLVRTQLVQMADRPTWSEVRQRIEDLGPVELNKRTAEIVNRGRAERDRELDRR